MKSKKKPYVIPGIPSLDEYSSNKIDLWLPTGLHPLDYIVHAEGKEGLPAGRIIVITGQESSGKSTLLAHIFAACHDKGISTLLCDSENTFDSAFAARVGLDTKLVGMLTAEDGGPIRSFEAFSKAFYEGVKKFYTAKDKEDNLINSSDAALVVGVDSLESLELEENLQKKSYLKRKRQIGDRAREWGPFWRNIALDLQKQYRHLTIIVLNQLRTNIRTNMFSTEPAETSPGGRAIEFYTSVHIRLKTVKKLTDPKKNYAVYASIVRAEVIKNKVGIPFRKCVLYNKFTTGFDNAKTTILFLADMGLIKKQGGKPSSWSCAHFFIGGILGETKEAAKIKFTLGKAMSVLNQFGWKLLKKKLDELK